MEGVVKSFGRHRWAGFSSLGPRLPQPSPSPSSTPAQHPRPELTLGATITLQRLSQHKRLARLGGLLLHAVPGGHVRAARQRRLHTAGAGGKGRKPTLDQMSSQPALRDLASPTHLRKMECSTGCIATGGAPPVPAAAAGSRWPRAAAAAAAALPGLVGEKETAEGLSPGRDEGTEPSEPRLSGRDGRGGAWPGGVVGPACCTGGWAGAWAGGCCAGARWWYGGGAWAGLAAAVGTGRSWGGAGPWEGGQP